MPRLADPQTLRAAFNTGAHAYRQGMPDNTCAPMSDIWHAWHEGYQHAARAVLADRMHNRSLITRFTQ